jgi:hypothetical protein
MSVTDNSFVCICSVLSLSTICAEFSLSIHFSSPLFNGN